MIIDFLSSNWGHFLNNGAVSILTVAVMDAIRLTLGQIFSLMDGF